VSNHLLLHFTGNNNISIARQNQRDFDFVKEHNSERFKMFLSLNFTENSDNFWTLSWNQTKLPLEEIFCVSTRHT